MNSVEIEVEALCDKCGQRLDGSAVRAKCEIDGVDLFLYRAKEAQRVNSEETGRVTLREDLGR